ncbi:hypothetical protein H2200_009609 [Cladophialophora chaetospira]|uniref:DUF6590 domain-containing protein n=1 Tax=Cladophialophora chaetospira TaxID=386627 RepID=A0AA38X2U8_9EURO|nr:hypothetical protein H2200_009609 [Cladophialophora chaetospira]
MASEDPEQASSYNAQQYEVRKWSEAPLRPLVAGSPPVREQTALAAHGPGEPKAFEQASLDLPPDSISQFLAIPAGDFTTSRRFILSHSELISVSRTEVSDSALQALDSKDNASFLRYIERLVLIDGCKTNDPSHRNRYLTRLVDGDTESLRAFYDSCNKYVRQARQSHKAESTRQTRQSHETGPTYVEEERISRPVTDQFEVKAARRGSGIPIPTSYSKHRQQQQLVDSRQVTITDSFPLSRSAHKETDEHEQSFTATTRVAAGQPALQRRRSNVNDSLDQPPPNASFYDPKRSTIPVSSKGYDTQDTTQFTSAHNVQPSHLPRPGHLTDSSRAPKPDEHTFSAYKTPTVFPTPLSRDLFADHQTSSFPHVTTSTFGQPRPAGQQTLGLLGHLAESQGHESHAPIKRPPPAPHKPSWKGSIGAGQDPQIPRLNTVRDKENIDYRGDVQRRKFESHREELDPEYEVQHSSFFVEGRVFLIPWPENFGVSRKTSNSRRPDDRKGPIKGRYGEQIFSHPVRMVVVQEKPGGYSHCIRISSYGGQGTQFKNIPEGELLAHAVIYASTQRAPAGEARLTKEPIAVTMNPGETLSQSSRIHFGKIYTVEHNVKVKPVGHIARGSMPYFKSYFIRENFPQGSSP